MVDDRSDNGDISDGMSAFEGSSIRHLSPTGSTRPSEPKDMARRYQIHSPQANSLSSANEKPRSSSRVISRAGSSSVTALASPKAVLFVSMLCAVLAQATSTSSNASDIRVLKPPENLTETAGRISSWLSTVLYLGSRL